jgi:hypothetical protein
MPLSTAVERGRRERSKRASDDRARDHVERIADPGVNARVRDERRCHLERDCGDRHLTRDASGQGERRRRVTTGKRRRARHVDPAGDRRPLGDPLTVPEVTAIDASPSTAARRPRSPVAARRPATAIQSFEPSAARDSAALNRSSRGVGVAEMAA